MNAEKMLPIDLLRKRRSLVAAKIVDPGPTEHELGLIIEAGLRVPDHGRCGPWRVQVISKKANWLLVSCTENYIKEKIATPQWNK